MRQRPAGAHKMDSAKPSFTRFVRDVKSAWEDGCNCQMCHVVELEARGERSLDWFYDRLGMYYDLYGGHVDAH